MTEYEMTMAKYIKDNILPKLQEIQRGLALDEHIRMEVNLNTYKMGMSAYFMVVTNCEGSVYGGAEYLCRKDFNFQTYLKDEKKAKMRALKTLRGIHHFVKNWQERLG